MNKLPDPIVYPILFPYGEIGFDMFIEHTYQRVPQQQPVADDKQQPPQNNKENDKHNRQRRTADNRKKVTICEFYKYRLQIRDYFSILHNAGKLFQQCVVDSWVRAESHYIKYIKHHQKKLRVADYTSLRRCLENRTKEENVRVGKITILPTSCVGGT